MNRKQVRQLKPGTTVYVPYALQKIYDPIGMYDKVGKFTFQSWDRDALCATVRLNSLRSCTRVPSEIFLTQEEAQKFLRRHMVKRLRKWIRDRKELIKSCHRDIQFIEERIEQMKVLNNEDAATIKRLEKQK